MKYYSIGQFAKLIGKTNQTLRNWDSKNILKPAYVKNNIRYYSQEQLNDILNINDKEDDKPRLIIGYARVSSKKQEDDLKRQIENIRIYMYSRGYQFEIISDIGSGLNYNKAGLNKLLELVTQNRVEKIVILYKDRLLRIGFELFENICKLHDTKIEIIDSTGETDEYKLTNDLIQIITVYSYKLQGKMAKKTKDIINELKLLNT